MGKVFDFLFERPWYRSSPPPRIDDLLAAYEAAPPDKKAEAMDVLLDGIVKRTVSAAAQSRPLARWERVLVWVILLVLAVFVWPTPYVYYPGPRKEVLIRVNRITGESEWVVPSFRR